jgi:phosphatidylglycerol---prolipoprotein diacylglyceryl transferase
MGNSKAPKVADKRCVFPLLSLVPIYWRRMVPFLHLWRLTIPTFGLMVAVAMLVSFYVLRADLHRRGIAQNNSGLAEAFVAIPSLAGIVGAKFYHVLETPGDLLADPFGQIFSQYGFAWFGGLLAGVAAFLWLAKRNKIPLLAMLDAGSSAAALGYGIGRIGCFLSGDGDYGIPTSLPWGVSFPDGLVPTTARVHPTPIYELLASCLIAWFLWRLGTKQLAAAPPGRQLPSETNDPPTADGAPPGYVFAAYLILTGVARFLVEFIRINPPSFLGLTNAQLASLASILAGALVYSRVRKT